MLRYNHIECLGYTVFADSLNVLDTDDKVLVNTINQYSYCIAEEDDEFKAALTGSDILLPDGVGIVAATRFLSKKKITKIAGADLHQFLLEKLNREKGSCFYLGASPETLAKIENRIHKEFPNVTVNSYSPPFKAIFTYADTKTMIEKVNSFQPDVLFVGMTAPKQEKWSYANKNELDSKVICSIGAVFDFYAGTVQRPNKTAIALGLEWFGRLLKEPKRMSKRYIYYGAIFAFYLLKEKWNNLLGVERYEAEENIHLNKRM